jgi:exonuclease SbcC
MAAGLTSGQPCPVCGSTEHPAPAVLTSDHVTREEVDQAEAKRRQTEADYERASGRAAEAKAEVSKLEGLGGAADPASQAEQLRQAQAELAALGDPTKLADALKLAQAHLKRAQGQADQAHQAVAVAHDQVVELQSQTGGASAESAAAALAEATEQVTLARRRLQAAQAVAQATKVAGLSQQAAQRALAEADFATPDQARAVRLSPAQIERQQNELTKLAGEESSIKTRLAEPALAEAAGDRLIIIKDKKIKAFEGPLADYGSFSEG